MAIGMHTVELHFHKTALTIDIASPSQNFVLKKKKKLQIQGKCAWGHLNHSALSGILSETVKGVCYMSFPLFSGSPPLNDLVCDRPVVNDPVFNNPVFCVCVCLFFSLVSNTHFSRILTSIFKKWLKAQQFLMKLQIHFQIIKPLWTLYFTLPSIPTAVIIELPSMKQTTTPFSCQQQHRVENWSWNSRSREVQADYFLVPIHDHEQNSA